MSQLKYRRDIDGLRAVAVISVILGHMKAPFATNGYLGVDAFFVISGYLITGIIFRSLEERDFSILEFYERRIRRIFPALFATIFATLTVGWFVLLPGDYSELSESSGWAALSITNLYYLLNGGYFSGPADLKPMLHTWSLGVEEQFYLVIPALLIVLRRFLGKRLKAIFVLGTAGSLASAIAVAQFGVFDLSEKTAFFLTPFRAWELMAGGLLALYPAASARNPRIGNWLVAGGLVLIVASVAGWEITESFPGLGALPVVLAATMIIAGGSGATWASKILSNRPMVGVGQISYSLYLVHWPILALFRYSTQREPSLIELAFLGLGMLAAAFASWRWIESPFRKRSLRRSWIWAGALAAVVLTVSAGSGLVAASGVPTRFPREVADMAAAVGYAADERPCAPLDGAPSFCRFGDRNLAGPTIALIGDSHVGAIQDAFIDLAEEAGIGVVVATRPGCPPLVGIDSPTTANGCAAHYRSVYDQLASDGRIEAVVLVARWSLFSEERGYDLGKIRTRDDEGRNGHAAFEAAFERTISEIGDGKTIFILGPIPEQHSYGLTRAALEKNSGLAPRFGVALQDHLDRTAFVDSLFQRWAKAGKILYRSPASAFCNSSQCLAAADGEVWYADDDHLTRQGALRLTPVFRDILSKAPGPRPPSPPARATGAG